MCAIGGLLVVILTYQLGSLTATILPVEYWLYSGIGVIFVFGIVISLSLLLNPNRGLATSMASLGIIGLIAFIFRIGRTEWTGNMIMHVAISCLGFATALALKLRDRNSKSAGRS